VTKIKAEGNIKGTQFAKGPTN